MDSFFLEAAIFPHPYTAEAHCLQQFQRLLKPEAQSCRFVSICIDGQAGPLPAQLPQQKVCRIRGAAVFPENPAGVELKYRLGIQAAMQAFQRCLLIGTAFLVKQPVSSVVFDKEIEVPDDIRSVTAQHFLP